MRLTRLTIAAAVGLSILACGGDLELALDEPLVADDDDGGDEEDEEDDTDDTDDTDDGADEDDTDDAEEGEAVEVDLGSAEGAVTTFAKAINAGDADALAAAHLDGCTPCGELAEEAAGDNMELSAGQAREKGDRAVARLEACEGDDCDTLVVYLEKDGDDWKVAWLDEDEEHGRGYLRGKAPAQR